MHVRHACLLLFVQNARRYLLSDGFSFSPAIFGCLASPAMERMVIASTFFVVHQRHDCPGVDRFILRFVVF